MFGFSLGDYNAVQIPKDRFNLKFYKTWAKEFNDFIANAGHMNFKWEVANLLILEKMDSSSAKLIGSSFAQTSSPNNRYPQFLHSLKKTF